MPELVLEKIYLRNWMTFKESEIIFPPKGFILVLGSNLASRGKMESSGAGKTALGEAICRALTGVTGRFTQLGECSTRKQGNLYVKLEAKLHNKPLEIELGFKCPELSRTGEGLRFTYDGRQIERGHINQTREELTKTIQVTPDLARWTIFIDGDNLNFNKLPEQTAVELLMTSLGQPPWTQYYKSAKKTLSSFQTNLTEAKTEHQGATRSHELAVSSLDQAKDEVDKATRLFEELKKTWKEKLKTLELEAQKVDANAERIKSTIRKINTELKKIEDENADTYHQLEMSRQAVDSRAEKERANKISTLEKRSHAQEALRQEKKMLDELESEPETCPTCGKPWDKVHSEQEIERQQEVVTEKLRLFEEADSLHKRQSEIVTGLDEESRAISKKMMSLRVDERVKNLSQSSEDAEDELEDVLSRKATLERLISSTREPDHDDVNQKQAVVEERQRVLQEAKDRVTLTSQALLESQEALKVIQYWTKAFSPTGIPNMVLKDSIVSLNDVSRRVSSIITGGTISISYDTRRELASGQETSELVINVDNEIGSQSVKGGSKGETGIANLIIAETLSEVGKISNRVGFRWYDEVLNSKDAVVRRTILAYLKELAERTGILLFVVDHHMEVSSYADQVLMIEKAGSGAHAVTSASWIRC